MITYTQITKSKELAPLRDYYVLDARTTGPDPAVNAISSISMLQIEDSEVVQEAVVRISPESDTEAAAEDGYFREEQTADSLARLLMGQVVVSEPTTLQFVRSLLERYEYEGEIFFVPIGKLACALFRDLNEGSIPELARQMEIPEVDNAGLLRTAYFENEIFLKCREAMGGKIRKSAKALRSDKARTQKDRKKKRISDSTLFRWAETLWSVSPWVLVAAAFLVVFFVILNIPRKKDTTIDRNQPPVSYLVLSWDQTGKYGTQTKARGTEEASIEFRIPYGVYNVLNNNSIPVELNIITDEKAKAASATEKTEEEKSDESGIDSAEADIETEKASAPTAQELSVGNSGEEEEDYGPTKVTMRPNSSRQIIVDTDQYLTLSEEAKDLIFFYVSEVPEERESDTTGQDNGSGRVVYAYVKGTEVRFRKSPSLEGAIIDSMQNGQQVEVLGVTGEWTHVKVQSDKGYIFSQFLTSEDPQAAAYAEKIAAARAAEEQAQGNTAPTDDQTQEAGTELSNTEPAPEATASDQSAVGDAANAESATQDGV